MKANALKRKVFQDAVDLLGMPETENTPAFNGTTMIPVEKIVPFHNHPFRLYEGERLDDMVESVREHGISAPCLCVFPILRRCGIQHGAGMQVQQICI